MEVDPTKVIQQETIIKSSSPQLNFCNKIITTTCKHMNMKEMIRGGEDNGEPCPDVGAA